MTSKKIIIDSEYEKVADACDVFREFCQNNQIAESISIKMEICLTEALNNVVKHSYKGESGNPIELLININDGSIEINITDEGLPRKKTGKPKLEFDPTDIENLPESGMGLFIIEEIMDETKYHSEGKRNTFTMIKQLLQ